MSDANFHTVVLVGPMGAGKSTIGRLLAHLLAFRFQDTDQTIEKRTGADISWIFDVEGEEGFRVREAAVLREALEQDQLVLATGGGVVTRDENRAMLKKHGPVVYLTADIEQLVERTAKDKKRPLLQVDNPREKIVELFNQRDPLYREVATITVRTDRRAPKLVAEEIARKLREL
ncbi:shikimate kinase AroK [Gilvimarinus sp. F26214L]|uniref:shikimate kinase AroK n=1 Tax=Gilvimarinus sp. DZF01 TaxID=3461371 RepID=UPI004045C033